MSLESDIALFFHAYASAFTSCDVEAIGDLWAYPAFLTAGERTATYPDGEAFNGNTEKLCEFYRAQGMHEAEKEVISIQELYPSIVQARTKDILRDKNGDVIAEWEHVYLLREYTDGWKAITAVADGEIAEWARRGASVGSAQQSGD
jgi:hypothetical protein